MLAWLTANIQYWHWIVFGLVLACGELLLPSFILLWFGISAILVGVLLLLQPVSVTAQLLIWVVLALINVWLWFKWITPRFKTESLSGMAMESMLGRTAIVITCDGAHEGRRGMLRFSMPVLGSDEWHFIAEEPVEPGMRVVVREFSGNALIITKFKSNTTVNN